jgi:uracil-DNA glycosylase family 4
MKKLNAQMSAFFKELYAGEEKVLVYGEGARDARLVLVGEAPGAQEALLGKPFVGKAGKNLDEFLALSGFSRDELYITNIVKFRPTKISAAGRTVNRTPTREEIALFLPWLQKEIAHIKPDCVVTLGNTALFAMFGKAAIGTVHGQFLQAGGQLIYPIYHPASLIYNRALADIYREDLERLARWREARR